MRGDDSQLERTRWEFHIVHISDHRHLENGFKNLRQILNLAEEAPVLDLKTNALIWGLFVSTTMKAAVLPTNFKEVKNLFDMTQRLILEHEAEFLNVTPID